MKQRLRKIVCGFLTIALIASAIAGAFRVSFNFAKADVPSQNLVWSDFYDLMLQYASGDTTKQNKVNEINDYIQEHKDDDNFNIFIMIEGSSFSLLYGEIGQDADNNGWFCYNRPGVNDRGQYTLRTRDQTGNSYMRVRGYALCSNGSYRYLATTNSLENCASNERYSALDFATFPASASPTYMYPCPYDIAVSGRNCYCLNSLIGHQCDTLSANIQFSPLIFTYELVKFNLGERYYLTIRDQNLIFNMQPLDSSYYWWTFNVMNEGGTEYETYILTYSDLTLIPNASSWLNVGLQNIHSSGVLCYDITDLLTWHDVSSSDLYLMVDNGDGPVQYQLAGSASNVPLLLSDDPNGQPDSYTQAWDQYNTYVNNYNTTHVVPEQLGEWLFGAEGSKVMPCTVQLPGYFDSNFDSSIHTFSWTTGSQNISGYDYSIMDVCIIERGAGTGYELRYWYDDTLPSPYAPIDHLILANLISSFDIIIICNDDQDYFEEALAGNTAYTGSSGQGITFTTSSLTVNNVSGFVLLTQRAIQKQQLLNFNDGITKLYQMEADYIESEDLWKDSFLLWSASVFDMINSLDGRLTGIQNIISSWNFETWFSDLSDKLDRIIDNTDQTESDFWYTSLWNWVVQFEPTDNDFTALLNQYDENWDNFPELPAPSTYPLLPDNGGG